MYTGSAHQLWEQFRAALWVIFWSALVTFILMKLIGLVLRGARYKDEILEIGDLAIHDEEAFPESPLAERVGGGGPGAGAFELAGIGSSASASASASEPARSPDPPVGSGTETTP
jgi:Amt family ammonium transporter